MSRRLLRVFNITVLCASYVIALVSPALAWGREGHEIVAHIAARELTPAARALVETLLGGDAETAMVRTAYWADEIRRDRPETAPWHYVDIELESGAYNAARDCPNDNCVVAQISKMQRTVADKSRPAAVRSEALKFLIHFVADVHQPLHDADNHDKGGNKFIIYYNGHRFPLHSLWDREMVEQFGFDTAAIAGSLARSQSAAQKKAVMSGTPENWANESFLIGKRDIYGKLGTDEDHIVTVPESYVQAEAPVVRNQLEKAGLRLSWLLNGAAR